MCLRSRDGLSTESVYPRCVPEMSLLVVRLTYGIERLPHVTEYLFWHWTCSLQPLSITRPLVTCTPNKMQSYGWTWLSRWRDTFLSLTGSSSFLRLPLFMIAAIKASRSSYFATSLFGTLNAPCLDHLPSSAYSLSRRLSMHKPYLLQVSVPPRMDRLSRTAMEAHTESPALQTTASGHTLTLAQAPHT